MIENPKIRYMTLEGRKPRLVVRKNNDYHKRGFTVSVEVDVEDTSPVDIGRLIEEIRGVKQQDVRPGRRKHDRKRRAQPR